MATHSKNELNELLGIRAINMPQTWEYGSVVAVQTGRPDRPLRVARVNGRLWNEGRLWEDHPDTRSPDEMLNTLGAEGWELVSVLTVADGLDDGSESAPPIHMGRTFVFYLKRSR